MTTQTHNMNETTAARLATISQLAADAMNDHRLAKGKVEGMWTCRNPKSPFYGFAVWFGPGVVLVWGDLGEFVLRHQEATTEASLAWFLTIDGIDYLGRKIRALDGHARRFCLGDALAYLDVLDREATNSIGPDDVVPVDQGGDLADAYKLRADVAYVRAAMAAVENETEADQGAEWSVAWGDRGDWDPPRCLGWTSSVAWLHECQKTMRRLAGSLL